MLDFEDRRPDVPRLPAALTRLERVLLAVVFYLLTFIAYTQMPDSFWATPVEQVVQTAPDPLRFVHLEPLRDRVATPKATAPPSDLDRRAVTPQPVPKPENDSPRSVGNSPEKFENPPPSEAAKGSETPPAPEPSSSATSSNVTSKVAPESSAPARTPGAALGNALRNMQRYLQDQTYDNPQGGVTDQGPDIQFDSKGVDFGSWLRRFRNQVYSNWLIPQAAMVLKGHVVIQLNIHKNGSITDIKIIKGSGTQAFDTAAFNSLRLSNPTAPLPGAYPLDQALFTVTFYYNER